MSEDPANRFTGSRLRANRFGFPGALERGLPTENPETDATDSAKSTEEFWDSVHKSRDLLAPLVARAAQHAARLSEIKRLVQRRNRAGERTGHPRLAKRARLVYDAHNAKITQFYAEFGTFTKEVLAAFEKLPAALPEAEVANLRLRVDPSHVKATCGAVQQAARRVEEFWLGRPEILGPTPATGGVAESKDASGVNDPDGRPKKRTARAKLVQDYKNEGRQHGVRITDKMIATAADSNWGSRTQVQKWKACDPRYDGAADAKIRRVLTEKPHLPQDRRPS